MFDALWNVLLAVVANVVYDLGRNAKKILLLLSAISAVVVALPKIFKTALHGQQGSGTEGAGAAATPEAQAAPPGEEQTRREAEASPQNGLTEPSRLAIEDVLIMSPGGGAGEMDPHILAIPVWNRLGTYKNECSDIRVDLTFINLRDKKPPVETRGGFISVGKDSKAEFRESVNLGACERADAGLIVRYGNKFYISSWKTGWQPFDPHCEHQLIYGAWSIKVVVSGDGGRDRDEAEYAVQLNSDGTWHCIRIEAWLGHA